MKRDDADMKTDETAELDAFTSKGPAPALGNHDPETLEIDQLAEKKLVRKLDLYIVPMVMLLYLLVCLRLALLPSLASESPRTLFGRH